MAAGNQRGFREWLKFDWKKPDFHLAIRCMAAMAMLLSAGILSNHTRLAVMATAGAFSVGFGSFHAILHSKKLAMFLAAAGMAASSWIGTLAGLSNISSVCVAIVWAWIYGAV